MSKQKEDPTLGALAALEKLIAELGPVAVLRHVEAAMRRQNKARERRAASSRRRRAKAALAELGTAAAVRKLTRTSS